MTPPPARSEGSRYFRQAASLRLSLQYNLEDFQAAQGGARIVYLMDANIVRFFLNPMTELRHTDVFGLGAHPDYAPATAAITAEFMFSRRLAGQGNRPAYIAPGHGEDLLDIISGLRRSTDSGNDLEPLSTGLRQQLDLLLDRLDQPAAKLNEAVASLRQLVPQIARFMHEGPGAEATHLQRLYDEDLLCPLALHPAATRDIVELSGYHQSRISEWTKIISRERHLSPGLSHDNEKVRRDAESIVQTMLLDEEAVRDNEKTFYTLVTADRVLFDAYARWFWTDRQTVQPDARFVLRTPLQYVPVLNVREMPNGILTSDAVALGRAALDDLLAGLRSLDARYPHILSLQRLLAQGDNELSELFQGVFGFNPFEVAADHIETFKAMRRQWHELFRGGVVLNAELMARRVKAEIERLALLLRQNTDLRAAIHEDQLRILGRVEAAHVAFSTKINIEVLTRAEGRASAPPRRAPLALRVSFPRILEAEEFEVALDRLASNDKRLIARVSKALTIEADHQALFFAACVAHRCGNWAASWHFATRALTRLDGQEEDLEARGEIEYLQASAARYALLSYETIAEAFDILDRLAKTAQRENDLFGRARALCELTSLVLVVLYASHLLKEKAAAAAAAPLAQHYAPRFIGITEEAIEILTQLAPTANSAGRVLQNQVWANVIAAEVLVRAIARDPNLRPMAPPGGMVGAAEEAIKPIIEAENCPPILGAEAIMARWAGGRISRDEARAAIDDLIQTSQPDNSLLTDLDRAELNQFRTVLRKRQTAYAFA